MCQFRKDKPGIKTDEEMRVFRLSEQNPHLLEQLACQIKFSHFTKHDLL